jgi:uncharacterized repeat protein (TIGR01451 family)
MRMNKMLMAAAASIAAIAAASPAWADGTTAGTNVNNTATLSYQAGTVTQGDVTSNVATFKVDRKVNLAVAGTTPATEVVGGALTQVTKFTVTNTSNAPLDFGLLATNQVGGAGPINGTDNFDVTNFRYAIDVNGDGVYTAGTDTIVTFLDEIAADASRTVFVLADIPAGRVNNDVAAVVLTATSAEAGTPGTQGANVAETAGVDNPNAVDTVFADTAGATDAARDGKFSARDQYNVVSATVTLVKIATVISDPFNGTTNPKAIPGATIEYCLIANNTGAGVANNVNVNDVVPTQTAFVTGSGFAGGLTTGTGAATTCDMTAGNGGSAAAASYVAGTTTFTGAIGTLAAGQSRTARFRVTVK